MEVAVLQEDQGICAYVHVLQTWMIGNLALSKAFATIQFSLLGVWQHPQSVEKVMTSELKLLILTHCKNYSVKVTSRVAIPVSEFIECQL